MNQDVPELLESLDVPLIEEEDGVERTDDVTLTPGSNSDSPELVEKHISEDIRKLYDVYSYRHAAAIFRTSFPTELAELEDALRQFSLTTRDIGTPGGNESIIPKKFSDVLRPHEWKETRIQGDLLIRLISSSSKMIKVKPEHWKTADVKTIENYIDGHKIDYVKGQVAFDLEWNSKDQTFDRDLYAFRLFHECGVISAAALVTRSEKLNPVFPHVPVLDKKGNQLRDEKGRVKMCNTKYGASSTWMGKLLYRMNAGRSGGCPVLIFGITPKVIEDWPPKEDHDESVGEFTVKG
ncbi:MAG: BglII/BstYI family type II restriction endonuclease [Pyrinomonadaceae bacterium]